MTARRAFAVSVFARHAGRVLLVLHRRLGTWLPAGGEINPGETPLEAARRELHEETGLSGRFLDLPRIQGAPEGLLGYEEHLAGAKGLHMCFSFAADVDTDAVTLNDELADYRWVADPAEVECPANVRELAALALAGGSPELSVARRWLAAFNAHDLEALLALYAEDAVHFSPKLRDRQPQTLGEIRGRPALRSWWADCFQRLPQLHYREVRLTPSPGRVFVEYERLHPGEAPLRVAELLTVEDGRIRSSRVYHG